jgi:DNA-binding transcriptional LysR family regulator
MLKEFYVWTCPNLTFFTVATIFPAIQGWTNAVNSLGKWAPVAPSDPEGHRFQRPESGGKPFLNHCVRMESTVEWEDLRYFLAAARHGSLSGAARSLRTTQPTMGRRLENFEKRMGAQLFQRMPAGLLLTEAGRLILPHAERMEDIALAAERAVTGRDAGLTGTVRISAPEWFAIRILAPLLGAFCTAHAAITVELTADARLVNLMRRETDLAFRFQEFTQDGIYQRKVSELPFGLYAAPDYLKKYGEPDFARRGLGSMLLTVGHQLGEIVAETDWIDAMLGEARIVCRSESRESLAAAAVSGGGLVCLPDALAARWPSLVRVETTTPIPARQIWLGVHADSRSIPRVRVLADALVNGLRMLAHSGTYRG